MCKPWNMYWIKNHGNRKKQLGCVHAGVQYQVNNITDLDGWNLNWVLGTYNLLPHLLQWLTWFAILYEENACFTMKVKDASHNRMVKVQNHPVNLRNTQSTHTTTKFYWENNLPSENMHTCKYNTSLCRHGDALKKEVNWRRPQTSSSSNIISKCFRFANIGNIWSLL